MQSQTVALHDRSQIPGTPRRDRYGLPLSTSSEAAAEQYRQGVDLLLSWNLGAETCFEQAILADDGFALPHAAMALLLRWRGEAETARADAERAQLLSVTATPREQHHVQAITDQSPGALGLLLEHLDAWPRDALALQVALRSIAQSGTLEWQHQMFALLDARAPAYGEDWWFQGAYALAHEELGRFEVARRLAERSLVGNPLNAGAAHPLAHVFYETDEHSSGSGFLGLWLTQYEAGAPYFCHLAWHLALFALAQGQPDRAITIYDLSIGPFVKAGAGLVDAASLLWRIQLRGDGPQTLPHDEVRRVARRNRPGLALADAHAALALAASGDEASIAKLIDGLRALDRKGNTLAEPVLLPLVQGIAAFGRGEYLDAIQWLEPIADRVVRIGGSNVQRDVFLETFLVACVRAGRVDRAEELVRTLLAGRPIARDVVWHSAPAPAG